MKATIYKTLLHSAIFLVGMATPPAQATVAYGVKGSAQAEARDDGNSLNDNHRFYDPQGVNEMYWDGLSVKAGSTASVNFGGRQAASIGRAWGYSGGVGLALSSDEQITDSHYYAKSTASAESIMMLNSSISGAAGSTGLLVLTGETYFSFSGGSYYNTINGAGYGYGSGGYSLGWLAMSFAPGAGGCFELGASCRASKQAGSSFLAGSSGGGLVPWRLELTIRAGDDISFSYRAAATVSAGAGLTIDNAAPTPIQPLTIQALSAQAMAPVAVTASGATRIWLSPGLSLADSSGLVQNLDGSYGFASPVPEADTWAMWLAGLGVVGFALRRRDQAV
ncbi:MAG: hypothetical protein B7Y41_02245 [Hydrogenophilales bacterium 28-61-23]|nr:MAG: hypothetical protein B7Y41_02245 [Hydrogenophilales bacterium 28-61-23]